MSRRDKRDMDRRDAQPEEGQQRHSGETDPQEGDSLAALKAILAKVAALLKPLQLTPEESIQLVEQLYGSVLEMDVKLAGEADDTRKSSVLAHIQNTVVTRDSDKLVVQYPSAKESPPDGKSAPDKGPAATEVSAAGEKPAAGERPAAAEGPAAGEESAACGENPSGAAQEAPTED